MLRRLRRYERAPWEVIRSAQSDAIARLVTYSARYVPYYRELFQREKINAEDIRTGEDLRRIPILNKEMIRRNGDGMISEHTNRRRIYLNASGGSTGKPIQLYQDDNYWAYAQASQWLIESWWGIRPGDRTACIWGTDRDVPAASWRQRIAAEICQTRICNAFAMSVESMAEFSEMLSRWQPRYVTGYASALALFSQYLLRRPEVRVRPVAVKSTAECLYGHEREIIEAAFACPVYNFYGSREVNNLAAECSARSGLHINALVRYIEILDESDRPLAPGVLGRIIVTDLTNYAMPLIRYEIEDVAAWAEGPCACGRSLPRLAEVAGRKSDFIVTPSGTAIHGEFFTHLFYDMPDVHRFILIQETINSVEIKLVVAEERRKAVGSLVRKRLECALGKEIGVQISFFDGFPVNATHKHRFVVSSVEIPWGRMPVLRAKDRRKF
jgi:phenylacetate-CoA ligase